MKRTNYLIATIVAAIVLAGQLALNAWTSFVLLRVLLGGPFPIDALYVLALQGLVDAIILVAFILTLVGIKYIGKDKETFKKGKALIITNIVFIFLVIAILAYKILTAQVASDMTIINGVSLGLLLVANILYIVDLAKEKNRAEVSKEVAPQPEQPKEEPVAQEAKVEEAPQVVEKPKTTAKPKTSTAKAPAKKATTSKSAAKPAAKKTTEKKETKTPAKPATTKKPTMPAKKTTTAKKTAATKKVSKK